MRDRSPLFDRMIRRSHTLASTVDVLYNRAPVLRGVNVLGGSVRYDRTASILASCSITFAEPTRIPTGPSSVLTPYGYELMVRRGITYADGTTETVGLGVFPIQTSSVGDELVGSVTASDRAQLVADAKLEDDRVIVAGTNYGTAIRDLIDAAVPGLVYRFTATTFTTPDLVLEAGADPWAKAQEMAKSVGAWLYFDGDGAVVLRPEPTLTGAVPVWTFDEGPTGVLLAAAVKLDRGSAYNRVIVTGENSSTGLVRGVATDTTSAIAYDSGFGRKPKFIKSDLVSTVAQAEAMAAADIAGTRGISRSVTISAVPHPALEPGDPVLIKRAELDLGDVHIIDAMTIGLAASDPLSADTRSSTA